MRHHITVPSDLFKRMERASLNGELWNAGITHHRDGTVTFLISTTTLKQLKSIFPDPVIAIEAVLRSWEREHATKH